MTRRAKALAMTLATLFALGGITASSAMGTHEFKSEVEETTWDVGPDGSTHETTVAGLGVMKCTEFKGEAITFSKSVKALWVSPQYNGCTITNFGSEIPFPARVTKTGCNLYATGQTSGNHSITHVGCEFAGGGEEMDIEMFIAGQWWNCMYLPEQTPTAGGIKYTNKGSGATRTITGEVTIEGLEFTPGQVCPNVEGDEATYTGKISISGTNKAGTQVGVWFE